MLLPVSGFMNYSNSFENTDCAFCDFRTDCRWSRQKIPFVLKVVMCVGGRGKKSGWISTWINKWWWDSGGKEVRRGKKKNSPIWAERTGCSKQLFDKRSLMDRFGRIVSVHCTFSIHNWLIAQTSYARRWAYLAGSLEPAVKTINSECILNLRFNLLMLFHNNNSDLDIENRMLCWARINAFMFSLSSGGRTSSNLLEHVCFCD